MHIPPTFHCSPHPPRSLSRKFRAVHTDFKMSIVTLSGNAKRAKKRIKPRFPRTPFRGRRLSLGAHGEPGVGGRRRRRRTLGPTGCCASPQKRQRRDGQAFGTPRCASPVRALPAPGDRRGGGAGDPRPAEPYLPLPLQASVYSGAYAVARGAGEELPESMRADLPSMSRNPRPAASLKPGAAQPSLRRRRNSRDRGVTLLPPPPRPPPPASPAWRSWILPSWRKRRGIAVQAARTRAALRQ